MTKIEWTDESWSPVVGCTKVSAGCENCYAEKMAARLAAMYRKDSIKYKHLRKYDYVITNGKWNGKIFCDESALDKPLYWKKPRMIFVESMGDLFHPSIPFEFIDKVFDTMLSCPQHTFQLLTKHPEIALDYYQSVKSDVAEVGEPSLIEYAENIWFGWTAENQPMMDLRTPIGLQIPAAVRFVSIEPCLSGIELNLCAQQNLIQPDRDYPEDREDSPVGCTECRTGRHWEYIGENHNCGIDWVIVGCESMPGGREGRFQDGFIDAAIDIVWQCQLANVPVFIKQIPINGKVVKDINLFPKDSQAREYPTGQRISERRRNKMSPKLPRYLNQTARQYKKQKRNQFKIVMCALKELNLGCAFLPTEAYKKLAKAREEFGDAYEICKSWWRGS